MGKTGIILEGGAMRSIYTAGILDFYLDKGIRFDNVLAVSAGAYAGMNYVSGQKGRIMDAVVKPMTTQKIFSAKHFFKTGDFFDMDLLFDKIPKYDCPFDFESFKNSGTRFITSTINCKTGEAIYHEDFETLDDFLKVLRVANSLPLLSRVTKLNGIPMMDGGMANAIPIDKALEEGWDKIVVVVTREATYRKDGSDIYNSRLVRVLYQKHRGLIKAIKGRPQKYNNSIDMIDELTRTGKVFLYRPDKIKLTNSESDPEVLKYYYNVGYKQAEDRYEELMKFLES